MRSAPLSSCLLLFVMTSNTYLFDTDSAINDSSEPKMASHAFMESQSNQLYANFPDSVQFTSQGGLENLLFGSPTESHDTLNPYQDSSAETNYQISIYDLGFKWDDFLEAPTHQPQITPSLALDNALEEVSCLGSEGNYKEAKDRKKNVETEGGSIKGRSEKTTSRHKWSKEEDRLLLQLVERHKDKWTHIAEKLPLRSAKQCRDRWHNRLRPNIKKKAWSEEEDRLLIALHKQYGNRWTDIAVNMPGRSENSVKNHWNSIRKSNSSSWGNKRNYYPSLLKDYIANVTSSSSNNQTNIQEIPSMAGTTSGPLDQQESSSFNHQNHQPMMSLHDCSSFLMDSGLSYKPDELVLSEPNFDIDFNFNLDFDLDMDLGEVSFLLN